MTQLKKAGRPKGVFSVETYRIIDKIMDIFTNNPDQSYDTSAIIEIMGKSLKNVKHANVRVRMWLDYLVERGDIIFLGVKSSIGRGRPSKEYKLK